MPEHGFPPHDFDIGFIHPCTVSLAVGLVVPIPTLPFTNTSFVNLPVPLTSSLYAGISVPIPTLPQLLAKITFHRSP